MKHDKYWASNPKKNGSYVDKARVEGNKPAPNTLKEDMSCGCKDGFKIMYKNSKDKKY
jgi:hypothetical protein